MACFTLPYDGNPLLKAYQYMAYPLGIIQANIKDDLMAVLCDRYINCHFEPDHPTIMFDIALYDRWFKNRKILLTETDDLTNTVTTQEADFVRLIRERLSNGWYVNGICNEEFIPGKNAFGRYYYRHDFLVYGYDDETNTFHAAGYLKDGFFHLYEIPYQQMQKAIATLDEEAVVFQYYRFNHELHLTPDFPDTLRQLKRYVDSVGENTGNSCWGITAVRKLGKLFTTCAAEKVRIDNRYTECLVEHKLLMRRRLEYLYDNGLPIPLDVISSAVDNQRTAETTHLLGIKYNKTMKLSIPETMRKNLEKMCVVEESTMPEVIRQLENEMQREKNI